MLLAGVRSQRTRMMIHGSRGDTYTNRMGGDFPGQDTRRALYMSSTSKAGMGSILGVHVVLQLQIGEVIIKSFLVLLKAFLECREGKSGRPPLLRLPETSARHAPAKGPCTYTAERLLDGNKNAPEGALHLSDLLRTQTRRAQVLFHAVVQGAVDILSGLQRALVDIVQFLDVSLSGLGRRAFAESVF